MPKRVFNEDLIKSYPRAQRKMHLSVQQYNIIEDKPEDKGQTTYISPYGLEFQSPIDYTCGVLLKIQIILPDYWNLKRKFVNYSRIDTPGEFRILAKVLRSEDVNRRSRKCLILAQTVNIDEVDEKVLKSYLQEFK